MDWRRLREELRRARNKSGKSLEEWAAQTGIDKTTLHRIENLKRLPDHRPDLDTIEAIATKGMHTTLVGLLAHIEEQPYSARRTEPIALGIQLATKGRVSEEIGRERSDTELSQDDRAIAASIVNILFAAAEVGGRTNTASVVDELIYAISVSIDPSPENRDGARRAIAEARRKRRERQAS